MSFLPTTLLRTSTNSLRAASLRSVRAGATKPSATLAARSFSQSVLRRDEEYEKHRVQTTAGPGTTKPMSQPIPQTDLSEPQSKPAETLPLFSMKGKVCVVTGGARGIGQMICRAFLEAECDKLAILDLNQSDAETTAKELLEAFKAEGKIDGSVKVIGVGVNIAKEESVQEGFDRVVRELGGVDTVVNSAGFCENFTAEDYPSDRLKMLNDVNILGSFYVARESAKRMQPGSSIVLIGSMSGVVINVPQPQTPYNFSKAAVIHMAKSLAVEWAPKGIRVNCISPGYVLTNLTKVILDKNTELRDEWVNRTPMGRLADPNDLKGAVIYLASDASAYTTGSNMIVDGGYSCI